MKIKAYMKDF